MSKLRRIGGNMRRQNFFLKFFLLFVVVITTAMLTSMLFFFEYFGGQIRRLMLMNNQNMIEIIGDQVGRNFREIASYGEVLSFEENVQSSLKDIYNAEDSFRYYANVQRINKILRTYVYLNSNSIYDILLIDSKGTVLNMEDTYQHIFAESGDPIFTSEEKSGFGAPLSFYYNINIEEWTTLPFVCNIYDAREYTYLGKLVILAKYDTLLAPFLELYENGEGTAVVLFNKQEEVLYTSDAEMDLKARYEDHSAGADNGENYYKKELETGSCYMIYMISDYVITSGIRNTYLVSLAVILFALVIIIAFTWFAIRRMLSPLFVLIGGMRRVSEGERNVQVQVKTGNEIEQAAKVFNKMVSDINENTVRLLASERKNNETQIRMLFYQINPHFIYNTLNCVICLARQNKSEDIISLTRTLIEFLRSILRYNNNAFSTIAEEQAYIDRYIEILQYSYQGLPSVEWEIDEGLEEEPILKQIMYPIIENSVFHGILPADHACTLSVNIEDAGDSIRVMIVDDGTGMTEEELTALKSSIEQSSGEMLETGSHIGLRNTNNRLKLIYQGESFLNIESEAGEGTVVWFSYKK